MQYMVIGTPKDGASPSDSITITKKFASWQPPNGLTVDGLWHSGAHAYALFSTDDYTLVGEVLKRFSNRPCTTWGGRGTSAHTDAGGPMRAYSMDLRERALLDSDAGMKAADVAAKYRVSGSWVRLLKQRRRETGEVAPRVQRQGRRGMLEPHLHTLAALIAAHPDRTLAELQDALATPASVPTVWRAVRALGLTVKKQSARPNTIGLTSRPRGSRGTRRRRPGMSPTSCVWTKPASPPICFGGTAGHHVARASTTTPPAGAGRPARFSPRCGSRG